MKVTAFCDGLTEPINPNGYGCCAFIVFPGDVSGRRGAVRPDPLHLQYACIGRPGQQATNNICEYRAVRGALRWMVQNSLTKLKDVSEIEIRTDSQLVVNQVSGLWSIKAQHLRIFVEECREMLDQLRTKRKVSLIWIPRDENDVADALTRIAYDEARNGNVQRSESAA